MFVSVHVVDTVDALSREDPGEGPVGRGSGGCGARAVRDPSPRGPDSEVLPTTCPVPRSGAQDGTF